jgi:putative protease
MTPKGNVHFVLEQMRDLKGNLIENAKGSGHTVEILFPQEIDIRYALLIRNLPQAKQQLSSASLAYPAH